MAAHCQRRLTWNHVHPPCRDRRTPDKVEPRVITSPEHCDQSVICRSSLGQIGNELSTSATLSMLADYFVRSTNHHWHHPMPRRTRRVLGEPLILAGRTKSIISWRGVCRKQAVMAGGASASPRDGEPKRGHDPSISGEPV